MRTIIVNTPGTPDQIDAREVPTPEPGPGEVRVRVEAAGVNPVDSQTRAGVYHELGWVTVSPVGLGWDVAGVVSAVGEGVSDYAVGDAGRTLLVTGAAGAVGGYAAALAVERGFTVTGLAREQDREYVESVGAVFSARHSGADRSGRARWAPDR